jgi:hypothetical protein
VTDNNYTPEADLTDDELDALLASLFGIAPSPRVPDDALTATTTQLVETPDGELIPVELTVRYPKGKLFEAAQSLATTASPAALAAFLLGQALANGDDRVFADLSALGYSADQAEERVYAILDGYADLPDNENPGFAQSADPYAPFRGEVADVVSAAHARVAKS